MSLRQPLKCLRLATPVKKENSNYNQLMSFVMESKTSKTLAFSLTTSVLLLLTTSTEHFMCDKKTLKPL